ncbi:centrosome-associated protein 350 isoform X3 [Stegostoma tigrinum]|uniref:centrosome-associated protein 350 isoform X3 n=1 Tax=Stegostoma tigrinum TaxID=3053191 RepID=UPI00286FC822|nr:centrosome-associated protein 350 isoform X3 [Stegostoma tigrinum]
MWSSKSNKASVLNQRLMQGPSTRQDLASAWDTVNKTKAALRHIENRLEAVPTTTAVIDTVMDTKKTSSSATRKISRRDGRYLEDSVASATSVKSGSRVKSRKDKTSRSPLRSTTLESNIKKSSWVEFRDPLTAYREVDVRVPSYLTASQLEAQRLLSERNSSEVRGKECEVSRMIYERDNRNYHCLDNESTCSTAVEDTEVKYLNDHSALDGLHSSDALFKTLGRDSLGQKGDTEKGPHVKLMSCESDTKSDRPSEQSQLSSPNSTSESVMQKLEMMRRKQHDDKLEKLKERIRKQREHSDESTERERLLNLSELPAVPATDTTISTAKVRKIAAAPPAPSYKGFNPMETKIRTPDGKVWCEDELHSISKDLYQDFTLQLTVFTKSSRVAWESGKMKQVTCEKAKEKKITKPVRKVQKVARSPSPNTKPSPHVISTGSWREGQKLVKMVLGPAPKTAKENEKAPSTSSGRERNVRPRNTTRTDSDTRLEASKRLRPRSSERQRPEQQLETDRRKKEGKNELDMLNTHVLPAEVQGILDDLQLKSSHPDPEVKVGLEEGKRPIGIRFSSRSVSPVKRKQERHNLSTEMQLKRLRHYDAEEVRQYIARQQVERKKRQTEEKKAQKEAMEQKNKRLQELYRKQKEAFSKPRQEPMYQRRLQETLSKYVSEPAKVEEPSHHEAVLEERQQKTLYQPSGESDKENKGQERPLSASSSSDMSLSEPSHRLQRHDRLESTWMPSHQLNPTAQPVLTVSGAKHLHLPNAESQNLLPEDLEAAANRKETPSKGQVPSLHPTPSFSPNDYTAATQKSIVLQKSKLDRIEALKAMAASLSNRIENGAKKLAGAGINYGVAQSSEHDVLRTVWDDGCWVKPVSPPVRDGGEDNISPRMHRDRGANVGLTTFVDGLPGVSSLYEFKKFGESPHCQASTTTAADLEARTSGTDKQQEVNWENTYKRSLEALEQDLQKLSRERKQFDSPHSSEGSISEGPLLSEGSLSEEDGLPRCRDPVGSTEKLKDKEFCAGELNSLRPVLDFQKEAEKYQSLQIHPVGNKSRAPWEELTKGSPHSVINIFTKSCQFTGQGGLEEESDRSSPTLQPLMSTASPEEVAMYEDDFLSSQSSAALSRKIPSYQSRPSSAQGEYPSKGSVNTSSGEVSPQSLGQCSMVSSRSSGSSGKKLKIDSNDAAGSVQHSPVNDGAWVSASLSERSSPEGRMPSLGQMFVEDVEQVKDIKVLEDTTVQVPTSAQEESKAKKSANSSSFHSPGSSMSQRPFQNDTVITSGDGMRHLPATTFTASPSVPYRPQLADVSVTANRPSMSSAAASMLSSPLSLQRRMTTELTYLDAIEESVRQLSEIDRTRGIALAQQETVSLAQILKAQQQRHEHDLALLKLKAEQEAVASQRQLEEARQKAVQVHAETLQQFAQVRQEMLQESTSKMMTQQVEVARLAADTARQVKEMTELACAQVVAGSLTAANLARGTAPMPMTVLLDQQRQQNSDFMKQQRARAESDSRKNESSQTPAGSMEKLPDAKIRYSTSLDSLSESSRLKHNDRSSSGSSSRHNSPSLPFSDKSRTFCHAKGNSSIEEVVKTAVDDLIRSDSMPSIPDEKDSASVATEYSLKFDESMTEDEIEEKSFRSLLPSESHRRFNMEKKRSQQDDSDEDIARDQLASITIKHDLSMPFSGGQDSFSKFTMEMVRQYMKEEEMRAQHQVSLLKLRERALKEKTKAELAWLEHQKKRLRDKGEDDKMPPIRKRQRGLLLRLQQEQAEIKRLQEANRAAHKERQLILKQQEEIQRMRQTTIKIQEKLKSAGESKLVQNLQEQRNAEQTDMENVSKVSHTSSPLQTDMETRSPSPVSISGSETSSIMQKLKKMRSHMDEKHCSPVHYFFSVFTSHHWASLSVCFPNLHPKFQLYIYNQLVRLQSTNVPVPVPGLGQVTRLWSSMFLTKREQKLMHRRRHAEELLEWKRRLDAEEAEIQQIEKQALAAWDKDLKQKMTKREASEKIPESKDTGSEEECPAPSCSQPCSDSSIPEEVGISPAQTLESPSAVLRMTTSPDHSVFTDDCYSQDFESVATHSKQSSPPKVTESSLKQDGQKISSGVRVHVRPVVKSRQASGSWSDESVSVTQSETTSDQSDIESRIRALKDELKKRKSIVDKLKKEQKKRQKERLKAQEASLIKQLESYDEFIKKTQVELSKDLDVVSSSSAKPRIKTLYSTTTEKLKIKPPSLQRTESAKSWKSLTESEISKASLAPITKQDQRSSSPDGQKSNLLSELYRSDRSKSAVFDSRPDDSSRSPSPVLKSYMKSRLDFVEGLDNVAGALECSFLPDHLAFRPEDGSGDESVVSSHQSMQDDIQEELNHLKSEDSDVEDVLGLSRQSDQSEPLLKLDIEKLQHLNISEPMEEWTPLNTVLSDNAVQPLVAEYIEMKFEDLDEEYYLHKESYPDEDGASDHSASSVKIVKSFKSDNSVASVLSDCGELKRTPKNDSYSQDFDCLSQGKETMYSKNFESLLRRETSEDMDESSRGGTCNVVTESAEALLLRNKITIDTNLTELQVLSPPEHSKQEEMNELEKLSQSGSPSISVDDEISEQLCEKSSPSCGSVHSEQLIDLKSATEKIQNEERSGANNEKLTPVPSHTPSPCHAPAPLLPETDELPEFQIGMRILVSSIQPGTLRFKGRTSFANGFWAGVELDMPEGSNNGTYDGVEYFKCREKCGIFAPPHKISLLPKYYEDAVDTFEDEEELLMEDKLAHEYKICHDEGEKPDLSKVVAELQAEEFELCNTPGEQIDFKLSSFESNLNDQNVRSQFSEPSKVNLLHIINESSKAVETFGENQNLKENLPKPGEEEQLVSLSKDQDEEKFNRTDVFIEKASKAVLELETDINTEVSLCFSSAQREEFSPNVHENSSTPLLDLLNREKEQLEAQFKVPFLAPESKEIHEEHECINKAEPKDNNEDGEDFKGDELKSNDSKANSLIDMILSSFVKDTVKQFQEIKKSQAEKIQLTNQGLQFKLDVESSPRSPSKDLEVENQTVVQLETSVRDDSDDKEEILSPDLCPRPGSPVFGTSGQEELAKRLAELELSRELLDDLVDDQDWFDEDFGLNASKGQQPVQEPQPPKAVPVHEEPYFAVPHDALEVEKMVHTAAEELWKLQELGHDLADLQLLPDCLGNNKGKDVESVSKRVYCEAVFNLTREIFTEMFAEDPSASQPPWMKPSRISSAFFRRARNPRNLNEVKIFISNEVMKLFGFNQEQNQKTDWQKTMKFGRKKRDRVDHILVQELHEEEAQWVNYDEDELCVKMQLADGIFDALIKDTINVLNQIQGKQLKLMLS